MSKVFTVAGYPAEVIAYAVARYSRRAESIAEALRSITEAASAKFFERMYFGFGHSSIADNAHVVLAAEDIPQLAAFELEDQQLWDGQERSTRFQAFGETGPELTGHIVPTSLRGTPQETLYRDIAHMLLEEYRYFSEAAHLYLRKTQPRPAPLKEAAYEQALRARAFDIGRYFLFGGIKTSCGQVTSARSLEAQIVRLLSSEYPDIRSLGEEMKRAAQKEVPLHPEPQNLTGLLQKLIELPEDPTASEETRSSLERLKQIAAALQNGCELFRFNVQVDPPGPVAPTLVKYTTPSRYLVEMRATMRAYARELLEWTSKKAGRRYVELAPPTPNVEQEALATLLYWGSNLPYSEILAYTSIISEKQRWAIFDTAYALRGDHDPVHPALQAGYGFVYDLAIDRGAQRDLHRHRRMVQVHQALTTLRGFDIPQTLHAMGLAERYSKVMLRAQAAVEKISTSVGVDAHYLIPFAFRAPTLYKMDWAQVAYLTELRTGLGGHFSYREAAWEMFQLAKERYPLLASLNRHSKSDGRPRVTEFLGEDQGLLTR